MGRKRLAWLSSEPASSLLLSQPLRAQVRPDPHVACSWCCWQQSPGWAVEVRVLGRQEVKTRAKELRIEHTAVQSENLREKEREIVKRGGSLIPFPACALPTLCIINYALQSESFAVWVPCRWRDFLSTRVRFRPGSHRCGDAHGLCQCHDVVAVPCMGSG